MLVGWMMRLYRWGKLLYASTGTMLRVIFFFLRCFGVFLLVMLSEHTCFIEHDAST